MFFNELSCRWLFAKRIKAQNFIFTKVLAALFKTVQWLKPLIFVAAAKIDRRATTYCELSWLEKAPIKTHSAQLFNGSWSSDAALNASYDFWRVVDCNANKQAMYVVSNHTIRSTRNNLHDHLNNTSSSAALVVWRCPSYTRRVERRHFCCSALIELRRIMLR